jgi:hypothetical protein
MSLGGVREHYYGGQERGTAGGRGWPGPESGQKYKQENEEEKEISDQ